MGILGFVAAILLAGGAGGATVMYMISRYLPPVARVEEVKPVAAPETPVRQCLSRDDAGAIFHFAAELSGVSNQQIPTQLTSNDACLGVGKAISIACQQLHGGFGGEQLCAKL
jgi:hypothetical protein